MSSEHEELEVRRELRDLHPVCAPHRPHHVPSFRLRAPALHLATVLGVTAFRGQHLCCEAPAAACLRDCENCGTIRPPLQAANRCRKPPRAEHLSMLQQVHNAPAARRSYRATTRGHGDQRAGTARHRAKGARAQHARRCRLIGRQSADMECRARARRRARSPVFGGEKLPTQRAQAESDRWALDHGAPHGNNKHTSVCRHSAHL